MFWFRVSVVMVLFSLYILNSIYNLVCVCLSVLFIIYIDLSDLFSFFGLLHHVSCLVCECVQLLDINMSKWMHFVSSVVTSFSWRGSVAMETYVMTSQYSICLHLFMYGLNLFYIYTFIYIYVCLVWFTVWKIVLCGLCLSCFVLGLKRWVVNKKWVCVAGKVIFCCGIYICGTCNTLLHSIYIRWQYSLYIGLVWTKYNLVQEDALCVNVCMLDL